MTHDGREHIKIIYHFGCHLEGFVSPSLRFSFLCVLFKNCNHKPPSDNREEFLELYYVAVSHNLGQVAIDGRNGQVFF